MVGLAMFGDTVAYVSENRPFATAILSGTAIDETSCHRRLPLCLISLSVSQAIE